MKRSVHLVSLIEKRRLDVRQNTSQIKRKFVMFLILHPLNSPPYSAPAKYVTFLSFMVPPSALHDFFLIFCFHCTSIRRTLQEENSTGMQNGEPFCIAPGSPSFLLFAAETCALCLAAGTGVAPAMPIWLRAAFLILVKRAVAGLTCHIDCL